jgi:hypothetical protein
MGGATYATHFEGKEYYARIYCSQTSAEDVRAILRGEAK